MTSSLRTWTAQFPPAEWAIEKGSAVLKDVLLGALRQGPVPEHIAFVMDGNRRYARNMKKEVIEGHSAGFEALARTLEICYKIGVKVVTVYAFSIENFKRTKYEVDALMDMAKVRLSQMAEHGELLDKYGCRLEMLGKKDLVRPDVLEAIDRAVELTKGNKKAVLNICAPYTSRDEMARSIRDTVSEYCQQLRPRLKRPFSETHIARNIQAQRMESAMTNLDSSGAQQSERDLAQELEEDEYVYNPTTTATTAAYQDLLKSVRTMLDEAADEHTATADDSVVEGATSSILYSLKDGSLTQEDKLAEVQDVLGYQGLSMQQLNALQSIANRLHDYSPPAESTFVSESTLNTGGDGNSSQSQQTTYPDIESITEDTLTKNTYTGLETPPLALLVRTSGVERLSDFMLWQCHQGTDIAFVDCYWPQFGLSHFIPILLEWQWKQKKASLWKEDRSGRQKLA